MKIDSKIIKELIITVTTLIHETDQEEAIVQEAIEEAKVKPLMKFWKTFQKPFRIKESMTLVTALVLTCIREN